VRAARELLEAMAKRESKPGQFTLFAREETRESVTSINNKTTHKDPVCGEVEKRVREERERAKKNMKKKYGHRHCLGENG